MHDLFELDNNKYNKIIKKCKKILDDKNEISTKLTIDDLIKEFDNMNDISQTNQLVYPILIDRNILKQDNNTKLERKEANMLQSSNTLQSANMLQSANTLQSANMLQSANTLQIDNTKLQEENKKLREENNSLQKTFDALMVEINKYINMGNTSLTNSDIDKFKSIIDELTKS